MLNEADYLAASKPANMSYAAFSSQELLLVSSILRFPRSGNLEERKAIQSDYLRTNLEWLLRYIDTSQCNQTGCIQVCWLSYHCKDCYLGWKVVGGRGGP